MDRPRGPLAAYFFFTWEKRIEIKNRNPDLGFGEVSRLAIEGWKRVSPKTKMKYIKMEENDRRRYETEVKNFEIEKLNQQ